MTQAELEKIALDSGFRKDSAGLYHPRFPDIHDLGFLVFEFGKRVANAEIQAALDLSLQQSITPKDIHRVFLGRMIR